MKTITGKGRLGNGTCLWLALVPDKATSCTDPRRTEVLAPGILDYVSQAAWLEGYAAAIVDVQDRTQRRLEDVFGGSDAPLPSDQEMRQTVD